jgi:hypothetical protein
MCVSCLDLTVGALAAEGHVRKQHIKYTTPYEMHLNSTELQLVTLKMDEQSNT